MTNIVKISLLILAFVMVFASVSCAEKPHEHSYAQTTVTPTCTEKGYTTYTCSCGYSYVSDYMPPEHNWSEWVEVEASTPTQNGVMERHCECGATQTTMDLLQ